MPLAQASIGLVAGLVSGGFFVCIDRKPYHVFRFLVGKV